MSKVLFNGDDRRPPLFRLGERFHVDVESFLRAMVCTDRGFPEQNHLESESI